MIRLIAMRELRSLFSLPSSWFVFAALQFVFAWSFLARLDAFLSVQPQLAQLANPPGATVAIAAPTFGTISLLLMMLTPMYTMRLIAEERRNQTLPLLLSAPVSDTQIALGKFLGVTLFLVILVASVPAMLYTLALGTSIDHGLMLANMLGLLLLIASFASLGLYVSALSSQPVIAAIGTLAIIAGLWLADINAAAENTFWHAVSPLGRFQNFNAGLLDSSDALFFALFTATFLLLTIRRLRNNRTYG